MDQIMICAVVSESDNLNEDKLVGHGHNGECKVTHIDMAFCMDLVSFKEDGEHSGWDITRMDDHTSRALKFVTTTQPVKPNASLRQTAGVRITSQAKGYRNDDAHRIFHTNSTNLLTSLRHPDVGKHLIKGAIICEALITRLQDVLDVKEEQEKRYNRMIRLYCVGLFGWMTKEGWRLWTKLGEECHDRHRTHPHDTTRASLFRDVVEMMKAHVRPVRMKTVTVSVDGATLPPVSMIDMEATCAQPSGWGEEPMLRFVAERNADALFLVNVGFLQGLTPMQKVARGKAISDGHKARPAEERAATAMTLERVMRGVTPS